MTDTGLQRPENQDLYDYTENEGGLCWAVVCDGMGGQSGGERASRMAVSIAMEVMQKQCGRGAGDSEIMKAMHAAAAAANSGVYGEAVRCPELYGGMGTTMVMAAINGRVLHTLNVGDSRIYSFASGQLSQLTKDHSLVADMVASGQITAEEARSHPDRNIITRAIGVAGKVSEDYRCSVMRPGEVVLLCTDGLSSCATDEQIAGVLRRYRFENVPAQLIRLANAGGGADNVTAVVMRAEE